MGQPKIEKKHLSISEWVELEQSGDLRYEYHLGEIFAMAGGTIHHTMISSNAAFEVENHFRSTNKNCIALNSEAKIEINKDKRYVYPDTLAICGEVKESEHIKGAVTNPILVIEVTSESSGAYDRGVKYKYYKRLPSVKEYLILEQAKYEATLYRRNGDGDIFSRIEFEGPDAIVELNSIQLSIQLGKFYRNVIFSPES